MGKSREVARLPNAPAFSAYRASSNQSVTAGQWTKPGPDTYFQATLVRPA